MEALLAFGKNIEDMQFPILWFMLQAFGVKEQLRLQIS